jgi:hypothetical protein
MVSLRPTPTQAIAHGSFLGAMVGVGVGFIGFLFDLAMDTAAPGWLLLIMPAAAGLTAGGAFGLVKGRAGGADVDDFGLRPVPYGHPGNISWQRIIDVRTERRGARIHIAVYLDDGQYAVLTAPYDGRLLGADPEFERKLFLVRHLWETHRTYGRRHG